MIGVARALLRIRAAGLVLVALIVAVPPVAHAAQRIDFGPCASRPVGLHKSMEVTAPADVAVPDVATLPFILTVIDDRTQAYPAAPDPLTPSPQTCPDDALPAP